MPRVRPSHKDLQRFAVEVREACDEVVATPGWEWGHFGDDKVFIVAAWEMGGFDESLAEFKKRLVAAHRARLLVLTRADLVEAMDRYDVQRSETAYLSATYHFIRRG